MTNPALELGALSAVKLTLSAKRMRSQSELVLRADPIAVVGMACRVPGGGDTLEHFWDLLRKGASADGAVPRDRWEADAWYDPDPSMAAKSVTKRGGFLDRIDEFDAEYFGILPREAERMDPQQRLFLEVAIEALDDAGLAQERLRQTRTGLYVASYHNDYAHLQYNNLAEVDTRTLTGTLHSVLANRLSYFLDLRGPSISLDTACSSSLVAVHLACQSLRFAEINTAIAGGVSLMVTPELMVSLSKVGFMSPDGRCKPFDARADGFGRGEGCGVVVLKRLSDAVADGDRVWGVIRGSAVNQDGRSTLLTAPNGPAQKALINEALSSAQIDPGRIGFFEAHGTGTALGDPIEVEAIAATVGQCFPEAGRCLIGSVKANLGHLEAAAGVVGVIKTVLALHHGAVPPQVNFSKLNPHISLSGTRLAIPTALEVWPAGKQPRCAAVNSFGVAGTNANVILEEAPDLSPPSAAEAGDRAYALPLSARNSSALHELMRSWVKFLAQSSADIADLCHTASQRRTHYDVRIMVSGRTKEEISEQLEDRLRQADDRERSADEPAGKPTIGFVFCGQGPQWYAMGRELLTNESVFRDKVLECDALLHPLSGWSLLEELARTKEISRLDQTEVAQPALFALQVGLAELWKSWGIAPDAVIGHSVGEIAALHIGGVIDLREAIRIVWHRGRIMQQATGLGRMASVDMTEQDGSKLVESYLGRLSVAAINSPNSVVLSGESDALEDALDRLTRDGVSHRTLPVNYAFHSAQMTPLESQFVGHVGHVLASKPKLAVYSTVTGGLVHDGVFDAVYFGRNMRDPVRFASCIRAMADSGCRLFIEIGPQPVLGNLIAECLPDRERAPSVLASLRRGRPERDTLLRSCATAYELGCNPDWKNLQPGLGKVVALPAYPWQRKRHWIKPSRTREPTSLEVSRFLRWQEIPAVGSERIFQVTWRNERSWLEEHCIFGRSLLPAAAMVQAFGVTGGKAAPRLPTEITEFAVHRPLVLPPPEGPQPVWQIVMKEWENAAMELEWREAFSDADGRPGWHSVATAIMELKTREAPELRAQHATRTDPIDTDLVYAKFKELGVDFGPAFRCLNEIEIGAGVAQARVEQPNRFGEIASDDILHPVLIDAGLQLCVLAIDGGSDQLFPRGLFLPIGADRVLFFPTHSVQLFARAYAREASSETTMIADLRLEDASGHPALIIEGMRFARAAEMKLLERKHAFRDDLYDVVWECLPAIAARNAVSAKGAWLVFADNAGTADVLTVAIEGAGGSCRRVFAGNKFDCSDGRAWVVDPAVPEHFCRLLEAGDWHSSNPLRGVIHCWSLDTPRAATDPRLLELGSVLHLVQALAQNPALASGALSLVTCGGQAVDGTESSGTLCPRAAGLWGLASVIAVEQPDLKVRVVDLDPGQVATIGADLLAELIAGVAPRVALRGAQRWRPRLDRYSGSNDAPISAGDSDRIRVVLTRPGTLDGVELQPFTSKPLAADEIRLRVLASGVNFRDVLMALDMYPGANAPLGAECVGVVTETGEAVHEFAVGDRVFGLAKGSLATEVVVPASLLAHLPDAIKTDDAASVPVAFLTAYYGLLSLAHLAAGERVLIHAAAGGVGLAAVQLAQKRGAEIYASAGSPAKRQMLRGIGVQHVMDSRSLDFADQIMKITNGYGVDVVLNSLSGDFIPAGLRLLASNGRFLEIGKRDIWSTEAVARLRPDIHYHVYDLAAAADAQPDLLRRMFSEILDALEGGSLHPLPVTVFPLADVRDAMRLMAQARHIGKIVLRVSDDDGFRASKFFAKSTVTYWITGGLGALGLETARWLVRCGARHLVLSGRRPPGAAAGAVIAELEQLGATVAVFQADAADRDRMQSVLDEIRRRLPPLCGVVHSAGAVRDAILVHQSWTESREVLRGKADGAWILHELTRDIPLDFFVLYSAAGVVLGAPGQGMYPAANAELDALARMRQRLGLAGLSVAWGPWADIGMAADLAARSRDVWRARGLGKIEPAEAFAQLERLLLDRAAYGAIIPIRWSEFMAQLPNGADHDFFRAVISASPQPEQGARAAQLERGAVVDRLVALPGNQRKEALIGHLTESALQLLGLDATTPVAPRLPLKEIGLDSLMAVEFRNTLVRSGGRPLPATLLFDYPSLDVLAGYLARVWGLDSEASITDGAVGGEGAEFVSSVAALSEEEAETLLLEELASGSVGRSA
jgi:acyl transferase domain-containing protein/NADPH:quinone reductase-like Zn-dependent oxidoreductase